MDKYDLRIFLVLMNTAGVRIGQERHGAKREERACISPGLGSG